MNYTIGVCTTKIKEGCQLYFNISLIVRYVLILELLKCGGKGKKVNPSFKS